MNDEPLKDDEYQDQPIQNNEEVVNDVDNVNILQDVQPYEKPYVQPEVQAPTPFVPVEIAQSPVVEQPVTKPTPGQIVLQWLTYAFWGWTVLAMSFLVVTVLEFFVNKANVADAPLYGMAAILVLLPISVICDIFYSKKEPTKKSGASAVVMIIHAVIFALFAIGSLITVVFSLVTLMVSSTGTENTLVFLYSAIIITLLYGLVLARTILPKMLVKFRIYFVIIMVVIVGIICGFGFFGPIADAQLARNDKLIESALPSIGDSISTYATDNVRLPDTLSSLTLKGDAKKLISDNLVTYKKDKGPSYSGSSSSFYYQLCVTYKKANESQYSSSSYKSSTNDYSTNVSTYYHAAGEVCYKVEVVNYSNLDKPTLYQ